MTGRIRLITTHLMPDNPPYNHRKRFALNHLRLPTWPNLPRILEVPAGGRTVLKARIRDTLHAYDDDENILAFGSAV